MEKRFQTEKNQNQIKLYKKKLITIKERKKNNQN